MNDDNKLDKIIELVSLLDNKIDKQSVVLAQHSEILNEHSVKIDILILDVEQMKLDIGGLRDQVGLGHDRNKREIDQIKTYLHLPLISDTPEI
jgi:hypothetical protein